MTKTCQRLTGFTLVELLIAATIIIALLAVLLPTIFQRRNRIAIREAESGIKQLQGELETYFSKHRIYPTTEQGLYALIYLPDNYGQAIQPVMPGMQPGTQPGAFDSMMNSSAPIGLENTMMQPDGMLPGGMQQPMMPGMTGTDAMGNPLTPGGGVDQFGNPTGMDMANPMLGGGPIGTQGTIAASNLAPGFPNMQLYTLKRPHPDAIDERMLIDSWNRPYRYDNTMTAYGVNQYTGTDKPAIWSAGRDGIDFTDDDIRSWDPGEVQQNLLNAQQRQMQTNQGMGQQQFGGQQGFGFDPTQQQFGGQQGFGFDPTQQQFGGQQGFDPTQQQFGGQPPNFGAGQPPNFGAGGQPPLPPFGTGGGVPNQGEQPIQPPPF